MSCMLTILHVGIVFVYIYLYDLYIDIFRTVSFIFVADIRGLLNCIVHNT